MHYRAILGKLVARTALHIGTGEGGDVTDELCRRDAEGNYIIPGTAIGGVLRTIATRVAPRLGSPVCRALLSEDELSRLSEKQRNQPCGCWTCHLFGDINPSEGDTEETGGRASRLFVACAKACLPEGKTAHIRDGVGIDRASRAAARAALVKFDLEVLPKGTRFELRLELEDTNDEDERLLAAALAEWQAGRAWLGGCVARGLGAFELCDVKLIQRDLSEANALIDFLKADAPWEGASEDANWLESRLKKAREKVQKEDVSHNDVAHSFVTIRFDLKIGGLFLTNDTTAAVRSGFDHAPLLDVASPNGIPILTGSSLRGVLRSHAERIARTLTTLDATGVDDFLAKCPACNPVESGDEGAPLVNCDTLLRKVAKVPDEQEIVDEQLCFACRLFGSTRRGSRLIVEDAEGEAETLRKVLDFLAIDRFTGGGKEGAKFDALALWRPTFKVRLHLENPTHWELGWLSLVLRDLADEMLMVGLGSAKGFGRATVDSFTAQIGFLSEEDRKELTEAPVSDSKPSGLYESLEWDWQKWLDVAPKWIEAFNKELRNFERRENLRPKKDTYFEGRIPTLYEKEAYRCLSEP